MPRAVRLEYHLTYPRHSHFEFTTISQANARETLWNQTKLRQAKKAQLSCPRWCCRQEHAADDRRGVKEPCLWRPHGERGGSFNAEEGLTAGEMMHARRVVVGERGRGTE